ncbi:hypothetical protein LCL89_09825 [Halobacillus yeomjeoni]|uniref:hypothetical protein n=1 Tax=Halobacillus yeomjeoni TaxID=311194 RepID=UPI001CD7A045|nr:hypothetical protein [Halobacillus yeomjeoni]MCA0984344.1 hypothetical protein [Halobacillus yeomjeoni]
MVIIITLSIFTYHFYQDVQAEENEWKTFVNHFYFSLERSIRKIDYLIEKNPEGAELEQDIRLLNEELLKADGIIDNGRYYVSWSLGPTDFFEYASMFLHGLKLTGETKGEVPPLAEDDQLDEQDVKLLVTIKEYLAKAKNDMSSKETGQEDPEITPEELNGIIVDHLSRFPEEIYQDAYQGK